MSRERDTTPSKQLPPVSSMDRRSDGQRIGPCPRCGGHRWWDNRAAKRAGQAKPNTADFTCVACRQRVDETDDPAPFGEVRTLPTAGQSEMVAGTGASAPRQCKALTKRGERCRGGAMAGSDFCGPHSAR